MLIAPSELIGTYRTRPAVHARRGSVESALESPIEFEDPENSHEETTQLSQRYFGEASIAHADRDPYIALRLARHSLCAAFARFNAVERTFQ